MKPELRRLSWLLFLLICVFFLSAGAALAEEGDVAGIVSPNQVTIAGETGSGYERTLLVRLEPGVEIDRVVPGDLNAADGSTVLPAESITASWPTPEAIQEASEENDASAEDATKADGATDAATEESAEAGSDTVVDPAGDTESAIIYPIPLTIAVSLAAVDPGQYSGEIFVITSAGELPVTLNVSVKAMGIWPMLVLLAGLGLGIGMSTYRKRGRRRDELLVEAGTLRQSMDADPELAVDAIGSGFRQRIDNELLDAQVALRSGQTGPSPARRSLPRSTIYVTWRSDRSNWIAQLTSAKSLRNRFAARTEPFFRRSVGQAGHRPWQLPRARAMPARCATRWLPSPVMKRNIGEPMSCV